MTDPRPVTCSLDPNDLQRRLDEIAAVGAASLLCRDIENGVHRLRFRSNPRTRQRLEEIIATEAECCPFLDLGLIEHGRELVLTLTAPEAGQAVADGLAAAFAGQCR